MLRFRVRMRIRLAFTVAEEQHLLRRFDRLVRMTRAITAAGR